MLTKRPMWDLATSPLARLCWLKEHFWYQKVELCIILPPWLCWSRRTVWSQPKARIAQSQGTRRFSRKCTHQLLTRDMMSLRTVALALSWQGVYSAATARSWKFKYCWYKSIRPSKHTARQRWFTKCKQLCTCSSESNSVFSTRCPPPLRRSSRRRTLRKILDLKFEFKLEVWIAMLELFEPETIA